jgi:hypothetical protein
MLYTGSSSCLQVGVSYLLLSTSWGHDSRQVCKVSKPYVNELWKYLSNYKNFNISGYADTDTDADADAWLTTIALLIYRIVEQKIKQLASVQLLRNLPKGSKFVENINKTALSSIEKLSSKCDKIWN